MSEFADSQFDTWRAAIDARLRQAPLTIPDASQRIRDAIAYSLTSGGKRMRGLLLMSAYESVGGKGDATALAAAIEIVHAYSLVHDDLPCMDDDSIRRGRPTTHKAFDVVTATVAGVVMVPLAVAFALDACRELRLDEGAARRVAGLLMRASGASGMVGGQLRDLNGEGQRLGVADLELIHAGKTGALISAALTLGGIAGRGSAESVEALDRAGGMLGLAFQIADDVLDATSTTETLGKSAGRDAALAKSTYASVLGVPQATARSGDLVVEARSELARAGLASRRLEGLADFIVARRS